MNHSQTTLIALLASAILVGHSSADLITGISIAGSDGTLPNTQMTPTDAVDGSGLSELSFTATHSTTWTDHWYSSIVAGAYITIDLGANYALDTIHVWNENENNAGANRGLKDAKIYVSPDDNPANLVALTTDGSGTTDNASGNFLFPFADKAPTYTGFDVDLSGVTNASLLANVRLVKIETITNHGSTGGSGLAEVQFGGVAASTGPDTFALTITPNEPTSRFQLEWESQAGMLYNVRSSTDLATAIPTWTLVQGDIAASGTGSNTLDVDPLESRLFYAVEEFPQPPLLSEDFESVTGPGVPAGWGSTDNASGTVWEVGVPSTAATGPTAAANGTQCAGTNIDDDYTSSSDASIISSAFTVPATGATLAFSQYIDTENPPSNDLGSIRLLNAADNTPLAGGDVATGLEGVGGSWTNESLALPAAANGLSVKLEFRFTSDASTEFSGFYIDDIVVTAN